MVVIVALELCAVDVGDRDAPRPQVGDVAVLQEDDLVGVGEDRRDVAREEALAVRQTHHQRHVLAAPDEPVALAAVHDRDGVGTLRQAERGADGIGEVAGVRLLDHVGERFGVGLRRQRVAARGEAVAQVTEVLDDPVVDDRDLARAVLVRVGVEVVGATVGGPARVGQADRGVRRSIRDRDLEIGELAGLLLDEQVAAVVDERDPGRVIAAVLQAFQPFHQDGAGLPGPRIANDAAHTRGLRSGYPDASRGRRRRSCEPSARGDSTCDLV